jgi:antirestriction protein ArdC
VGVESMENSMNKYDRAEIIILLIGYVSAEWITPKQAMTLSKYYGILTR